MSFRDNEHWRAARRLSTVPRSGKRWSTAARALTLIEVVISTLVVSVTLIAALHAVGGARLARQVSDDRARAMTVAEDLMSEILLRAYDDPQGTGVFGPDPGEDAKQRATFDDVDDYDRWTESPPTDAAGTALPGLNGWERRVQVLYVARATLLPAAVVLAAGNPKAPPVDTGLKRVRVTVLRDGRELAVLDALRSRAAPRPAAATESAPQLIPGRGGN